MITMEYDWYNVNEVADNLLGPKLVHAKETFEDEEDLQETIDFIKEAVLIKWDTVSIMEDGRRRRAKLLLEEY
jgi:hypothetical protein